MSDTFYTASPDWAWYIILYFFVGGIAGCCFVLASLLRYAGRAEDAPVIRLGYQVALAGSLVSALLLTLDLRRPERFWHMLIQSDTGSPMFKYWSPMSVGAWALLLFGMFAFLATCGTTERKNEGSADRGIRKSRIAGAIARLVKTMAVPALGRGIAGAGIAGAGSILGLFIAGYTGVLLSVTNRPLWADSQLLGVLFLFSGASTAAASLVVLGVWRGAAQRSTLEWLARFDRGAMALEVAALALFLASLGSVVKVLAGWWGLVLMLGVLGAGIVAPLIMERRAGTADPRRLVRPALLVLLGGLLLRTVVIFSSEEIHVLGSGVVGALDR